MSFIIVIILIAATVVVTNMLVENAGGMSSSSLFLDNYKKSVNTKTGTITLDPFDEITNTFIVLHDYADTANETSQYFVPINEKVILPEPTRLVFP